MKYTFLIYVVGIVIVVAIGVIVFNGYAPSQQLATPTPCTSEQNCSRGSTVTPIPGWKTQTDATQHITFMYPPTFDTTYIRPVDWPPQVQKLEQAFTCTEAGKPIDRAGQTRKQVINNTTYCVTQTTEGAAGSIYTMYAYAFAANNQTIIFTFSTQTPQCDNFDNPQKSACQKEVNDFKPDTIINNIVQTLKLNT